VAAATEHRIDAVLREGVEQRGIPAVVAIVGTASDTLYTGAFGIRDSASTQPVTVDSIFAVASMTKAITTTAILQLVEQGRISLDDPMGRYLPEFAQPMILTGFEGNQPILRPATRAVTIHHLLTHTSGFAYDHWNADMYRLQGYKSRRLAVPPLMSEPGTRWEYSTGLDWAGRIVEVVSGLSLETYFQRSIFAPLGMKDSTFTLSPEKFPRKVSMWRRQPGGDLHEDPYLPPPAPAWCNGGGGLYSTAPDYLRFMQMILQQGGPILRPESVAQMSTNQTGSMQAVGRMQAARPEMTADVDFHPGFEDQFTFGFLRNPVAHEGGRSAGSLAWGGIQNTFYWIDPQRSLCAAILMQFLPFCDPQAMGLLRDFERAVYSSMTPSARSGSSTRTNTATIR
jgi:CubicO group peptidase (beta-lactamase class C family)